MIFGAIVNGINSLISLSVASLLVYRNATDFCALILYPATLLNLWISSSSFWWIFFHFAYSVSCHLQRVSLTSSWPAWIPFISLCIPIAEAKTSNIVVRVDIPVLFLTSGESPQFFPIEDETSCGPFVYGLFDVEVCSF